MWIKLGETYVFLFCNDPLRAICRKRKVFKVTILNQRKFFSGAKSLVRWMTFALAVDSVAKRTGRRQKVSAKTTSAAVVRTEGPGVTVDFVACREEQVEEKQRVKETVAVIVQQHLARGVEVMANNKLHYPPLPRIRFPNHLYERDERQQHTIDIHTHADPFLNSFYTQTVLYMNIHLYAQWYTLYPTIIST